MCVCVCACCVCVCVYVQVGEDVCACIVYADVVVKLQSVRKVVL